jgi:quercetin dioxygenase-like cupin family protein
MGDTTVKKVSAGTAPHGRLGQRYLSSGKRVSMRLWEGAPAGEAKPPSPRDDETIGYVKSGPAERTLEGQTIRRVPGAYRRGPPDAEHHYRILEPFTAVEATAPPAQVHGRDES